MTLALVGRDIYMRHTSADGGSYVQCHRVWDAARFIASQAGAAAKVNADQKGDSPRLAKAVQITEDQYRKERS